VKTILILAIGILFVAVPGKSKELLNENSSWAVILATDLYFIKAPEFDFGAGLSLSAFDVCDGKNGLRSKYKLPMCKPQLNNWHLPSECQMIFIYFYPLQELQLDSRHVKINLYYNKYIKDVSGKLVGLYGRKAFSKEYTIPFCK